MRLLLRIASMFLLVAELVGCVGVSFALVGWYMVASGAASPGQPMYLDELAPSAVEIAYQLTIGIALIAGPMLARTAIGRRMAASAV
jgi:hypothetical protein